MKKELFGEFLGTFILVFFGCGSVGVATFLGGFSSLYEVAIVWGIGVALAIFISRNLCPAHLNPAVSFAMALNKSLPWKKLLPYSISQFFGAMFSALILYALFSPAIANYETANEIIRGGIESSKTASMFGEFYPNPGFKMLKTGHLQAMLAEFIGTFLLVLAIFKITEKKEQASNLVPIMIGLTVTVIICIIAPFTQAGLNPARDFGPRLVAFFMGWGKAAFPIESYGFFTVYILSPIFGGTFAYLLNRITRQKEST
jgi:glycerol uptake facilitator protein